MFIDQVVLSLKSGKGGSGAVSFRREKYIPRGGPDGGDGGRGGHVILKTVSNCYSLVDYRNKYSLSAGNGKNGSGKNKSGSNGSDLIVILPPGTIVKDAENSSVIVDLSNPDSEYILLTGGRGGFGNSHFKSSTNQTPRFSQPGEPGQSLRVSLELKLLASVGLVGFPNAGKSTLISRISNAKPKIADYPFSTLVPNLGVLDIHYRSLVVADIPGLIEGAHQGHGMGITFLRHIERTKLLVFMIDSCPSSSTDPVRQLSILLKELEQYNSILLNKKKIVVLNKVDLLSESDIDPFFSEFKKILDADGYIAISSLTGYNIDQLKEMIIQVCPNQ